VAAVRLFPDRHSATQFVEEVQEDHDFVLLLGRFRGFHGSQYRDALAVRSQVPPVPPSLAIHTRGFAATNVSPFTV